MIRKVNLLIAMMCLIFLTAVDAKENRQPRVMNFNQLEPLLKVKNDTVYLVNFWATWCAPCVKELPAIKAVEKKYSNQKFKVLLVSLDVPSQLNSRLIPFIRNNQISSEVILLDDPDQNTWIDKVDKQWSGEIPFTLIYGKNFRDTYSQPFSFQSLDSIINHKIQMP